MERLTERRENEKAVYRHPTPEPEGWEANRAAVLERCCSYEDTGLEPAEIACMQIRYKKRQELLEQAAECIENCYGRETDLSEAIRKEIN